MLLLLSSRDTRVVFNCTAINAEPYRETLSAEAMPAGAQHATCLGHPPDAGKPMHELCKHAKQGHLSRADMCNMWVPGTNLEHLC